MNLIPEARRTQLEPAAALVREKRHDQQHFQLGFQDLIDLLVLILIAEGNCDFPSCQVMVLSALPPEREAMFAEQNIGITFEITRDRPRV